MGKKLKIKGKTKKNLEDNIARAMNLAALFAHNGALPTTKDLEDQRWWIFDEENRNDKKYNLDVLSNDYKAFVREESKEKEEPYFVVVEFHYRYDTEKGRSFQKNMTKIIFMMMKMDSEIIE